jgi:predicted GIY-YIG superfamily endonuclease
MTHLYIIAFTDGSTKVGITKHAKKRLTTLQLSSGKTIKTAYVSAPFKKAKEVERLTLFAFKNYKTHGEWFEGVRVSKLVSFVEYVIKKTSKK